jgi:hypothetical protein
MPIQHPEEESLWHKRCWERAELVTQLLQLLIIAVQDFWSQRSKT